MEEGPLPLKIKTPKEEIIEKKEYLFKYFNDEYNLIIERDIFYIYFKLLRSNEIDLCYYKNKFELKNIIKDLNLNHSIYKDLKDIFLLIEKCWNNNNIFLNIKNDMADLIIKITNDSNTYEKEIHLFKSELDIDESFDLIINEIKSIKSKGNNLIEDDLSVIQILLNDIKNDANSKINEGYNKINSIEERVFKDINKIQETSEEINNLKKRISYIKKHKENLNVDNEKI